MNLMGSNMTRDARVVFGILIMLKGNLEDQLVDMKLDRLR